MALPNEKLAAALEELRRLQRDGARVFGSEQLTRAARERLVDHGFLQEVMKGWLISASPSARPGDTTPWYASFWEFCQRYCDNGFTTGWHLSPEQSLLLHAEHTVIPRQVIVYSPDANNNRVELLFGTSLFAVRQAALPPAADLTVRHGVRVFTLEAALVRVPRGFFADQPVESQVALAAIREPSGLLERLLAGGHSVVAGRLAGALRRVGRAAIADEIVEVMTGADYAVREIDPFEAEQPIAAPQRRAPPIVTRLATLWAGSREAVLAALPRSRRPRRTAAAALRQIDEVYALDAYHSLSIEGYQVSPALIERVAAGAWDPAREADDRDSANALAARGYWQAFQRVRGVVERLVSPGADVAILRAAHRAWYREMFSPHVAAGLLAPALLAGYRSQPVYLRGSRHLPPRADVVGEAMPALFSLVEREPEPAVRAVLGHWLFGYVHPFPDGNGRIARFLMNALLVHGGYPWTVIRVDDRPAYLAALETASVGGDVRPFAQLIARQVRRSRPRTGRAVAPRRRGRPRD